MKRIAIGAILLALVATAAVAQEAQQEPMYVSLTYVSVRPEMTSAFMAALADHLDWHKSSNDTHYYTVSQVVTGPRTGQTVFVSGPMTGAQLDDYNAFGQKDMADIAARGIFGYVDGVETIVMQTIPGLGSPPPPAAMMPMTHVYELELGYTEIPAFTEALGEMDELQKGVEGGGYNAWVMPVSGTGFNKRWWVTWVDGWADTADNDPAREAKVVAAAGGQDAYQALLGRLMGAVVGSSVTTYMALPALSFRPNGQ